MAWLEDLAGELAISAADPVVIRSIVVAVVGVIVVATIGAWWINRVSLLPSGANALEVATTGLAAGLLLLAAFWAAAASSGASAMTPIAGGFALSLGISVRERRAHPTPDRGRRTRRRDWSAAVIIAVLAATFLAAAALLYGATMAQSARAGRQPIEFMDEAFYAVLGRDLGRTGVETIFSPSGLARIGGVPAQAWYHWGEIWLTSIVSTMASLPVLAARSYVILPTLLLAVASTTGALVQRFGRTSALAAYTLGFLAALSLAPVPLLGGTFFADWAVGLVFGITLYGLAAVAVVLLMLATRVLSDRPPAWSTAGFVGTCAAMLLPTHPVIALLAATGVTAVTCLRAVSEIVATRRLPRLTGIWARTLAWTAVALLATVAWGYATGHGLAGSGSSPSVTAFNGAWRTAVLAVLVGSGGCLAIAVAWFMARRDDPIQAWLYVGVSAAVVAGVLAWGARLGDFNMFHVFFGAIAVFVTPAAAIAIWTVWTRLRASPRPIVRAASVAFIVLCLLQIGFGTVFGVLRLQRFGPGNYEPVPTAMLDAIRALPPDAKLAYACQPDEEQSVWDPRLLAVSAHTDRRIIPMCFQADALSQLVGGVPSNEDPSPLFERAPQRLVYPTRSTVPTEQAILTFLDSQGIDYVYVDPSHPNQLVPDARPVFIEGPFAILRVH